MDYDEIFENYYTLYRAETPVPTSTDDEYVVGKIYANNAINRWANVDGVYWNELYDTNQSNGTGAQTIVTGQANYTVPTNFRKAGGKIRIKNTSGQTVYTYNIVSPEKTQFLSDNSSYAYFKGNPSSMTLYLNPAPEAGLNGLDIDYIYYKKPTKITTGSSTPEMANPWFIVHHMLATRFRVSRNWSGYQTALRDAEEALKNMQQDNISGSFANPFALEDNTASVWGA